MNLASFRKNRNLSYIVLLSFVALLLLAWLSLGEHGIRDLCKIQKEKERCLAILNDLWQKNRLLTAEIRRLKEDPEYFESVARKELGLVKENEIIYRFKEQEKNNERASHGADLTRQ